MLFLKDYFTNNKNEILKSEHFRYDYLPLLRELINDEDNFIQLDAVEAYTKFSEELSKQEIENDFMPCVLLALDIEHGDTNIELLQRATELVGIVAYKLSEHGMHMAFKKEIMEFWMEACSYDDHLVRKWAAFNLPALAMLYKEVQDEFHFNFF